MRTILIVDDWAREQAAKIIAYSKEHPYSIGGTIPGDIPEHVMMLGDFRIVYSDTHHEGKVARHLSVSLPAADPDRYPHPIAINEIAKLFEFEHFVTDMTGNWRFHESWLINVNKDDHCIVLVQFIGE